jgi:hypothetical protein
VIALQVSGPAPAPGYSFNHINLGDSTEKLMAQFGAPSMSGRAG